MQQKAFTIIELVVVLMLLSLILAISLPVITDSLAYYQTVTSVRKIVSDIQYIQMLATKKEDAQAAYEIQFNPGWDQYSIYHGPRLLRREKLPALVDLHQTNFTGGGVQNVLIFNIQGNPVQGGTITLVNRRSGKVYQVRVAVLTGRVRVEAN